MQTVNFFMPVNIPTGHPTHILEAAFLGRAIIENEPSDEFTADGITASIQDLFFLADTTKPTETAERVELPDPYTAEGRMFRSRLETAAKDHFLNAVGTPLLLPDEVLNVGDTVIFPTVTAKELLAIGVGYDFHGKIFALCGKPVAISDINPNSEWDGYGNGEFSVKEDESQFIFPLQWLRK